MNLTKSFFCGKEILNLASVFEFPLNSKFVGIFKTNQICYSCPKMYNVDGNTKKIAHFEYNDVFYFTSLLH